MYVILFIIFRNNKNLAEKMGEKQDYQYHYYDDINEDELESCIKRWQKQKFAQNQHVYMPTQAQIFDKKIIQMPTKKQSNNSFQQNPVPSLESTSREHSTLVGKLKQKLPGVFTDYIKNCMKIIKNVQFQSRSSKRSRKFLFKDEEVLCFFIDNCELLGVVDYTEFNQFLLADTDTYLRVALGEVLLTIQELYRSQLVYIFFEIIQKLQEITFDSDSNNFKREISQVCSALGPKILSTNKVNQLIFSSYANQQQSIKIQQLFIQLLQQCLIIIYKLTNNKIQQLHKEYEGRFLGAEEEKQENQLGARFGEINFCFQFQEQDMEYGKECGSPRKKRFAFQ